MLLADFRGTGCQPGKAGLEPSFIGGGSVEGRHRRTVQPQIDGQLSAVVRQVTEDGVPKHDEAGLFRGHVAGNQQPPRFEQMLIGGIG